MTSTRHDAGPVAPIVQRATPKGGGCTLHGEDRATCKPSCSRRATHFARSKPASRTRKESLGDARNRGERETPIVLCAQTFHNEPNQAPNPDMIRQRDYAIHSNLTKGHISALVKRGMPLDSVQAADDWRRAHTLARKLPAPPPQEPPAASPAAEAPERPPETPERPAPTDPAALESTRVGQAFQRLEKAERVCWGMLAQALKNQAPDAARLLDLHSRSVRHLADSRQDVLNLAEREKTLVSGNWVRRVMLEHDGAVAYLLKAMPKQLSGRISPHDPEHCEIELTRWVQEVALATLHSTDPWR